MPKSRSNKFEHDFWLKAVLTRVRETDSCVAVLSRTSAILPHNRLARLAYSAIKNGSITKASLRAVGGSSQTGDEGEFPRAPLIGCYTASFHHESLTP